MLFGEDARELPFTALATPGSRNLPGAHGAVPAALIGAPRPWWTYSDGRSPGLRVIAVRRLPRTKGPSGRLRKTRRLQLRGQLPLGLLRAARRSLLIPSREPSRSSL